ncbi:hypothetical protein ACWEFJ_14565 [Actinosynnema sp. NPDC004786]
MAMQPGKSDPVEHSVYYRVSGEADFIESVTADGDYEVSFDRVATLALTRDAAEKLHRLPGERIPELRRATGGINVS